MIDWYVEILEHAQPHFRTDKFMDVVIKTASPCMEYFCNRLSEIENWRVEDAAGIFGDIIEELPIMNFYIDPITKEFIIKYNSYVFIKLTDTTKQIYRDIKLEKILD